ncbi:MAG TPA: FCD domain-containing protein [Opitutaceae bacterium]|nr:FCD domain-containing protein [Opitutaceae bacterium]
MEELSTNSPSDLTGDDLSKTSLTGAVREKIEVMIMRGEIEPGARLNEKALATKLNVSRGPIREATRLLAEAGFVTMIHNRGAFAREIKLTDVLHGYDVRAGLAHAAGRLAALRATKVQVAELRNLWEQMEGAVEKQDSDLYAEINRTFHTRIVDLSRNPRLIDFYAVTERELFLFLRRGVAGSSRPRLSNQEHARILEAISNGDEMGAAHAFETHILNGKQRMLETLA